MPFLYNPADRAFIVTEDGRFDLDDLLPAGSDWRIVHANDINNKGEIVGIGISSFGPHRAVLLKPE